MFYIMIITCFLSTFRFSLPVATLTLVSVKERPLFLARCHARVCYALCQRPPVVLQGSLRELAR